jgi:hypothetical protein
MRGFRGRGSGGSAVPDCIGAGAAGSLRRWGRPVPTRRDRRYRNSQAKIKNPKFNIQNRKAKIEKRKSKIGNQKSKINNLKFQISDSRSQELATAHLI